MKKVMLLASKEMCDILQAALGHTYIALPCSDPEAGSELLRAKPDALVLELSLPGANGMTFLKAQADNLPPVVLVLTPFISDTVLAELVILGVSSVFLIPCRISQLTDTLAQQLA